ncbi:MAG TPA: DNA-binding protein [Gammaproteobacteria bacterium]
MAKRYLRQHQVRERYGRISYTTLWRRIRNGDIPAPVKIGGQNHWDERELDRADAERERAAA